MPIELIVVTPEGEAFSEPVEQVVLPGTEGEFGVLEAHERFLSPLTHGAMKIILSDGTTEYAAISDGFAEVDGSKVVVLVDACYKAHEIDLDHALRTKEEAEAALAALSDDLDQQEHRDRHEDAVVRASVQIEVHGLYHN